MQVVMNKCFLLNLKKIGADWSCRFREKHTFNSKKNNVTEPKARLLRYQSVSDFQKPWFPEV